MDAFGTASETAVGITPLGISLGLVGTRVGSASIFIGRHTPFATLMRPHLQLISEVLLDRMEIFIELIVGVVDENDCTCEPWIGNRVEEMKDVGTFRVTLAKPVEVIHVAIPLSHIFVVGKIIYSYHTYIFIIIYR